MLQHALDDVVGALAVLDDLFQVAGQQLHRIVGLGALLLIEGGDSRSGRLLQFVEQLDRETGEVVDEVQRVLDLVRNPGGELAEGGHLLGLDQIDLRRLEVAVGRLRRIARRTDFLFAALAFGDVAVDQHKPAAKPR